MHQNKGDFVIIYIFQKGIVIFLQIDYNKANQELELWQKDEVEET